MKGSQTPSTIMTKSSCLLLLALIFLLTDVATSFTTTSNVFISSKLGTFSNDNDYGAALLNYGEESRRHRRTVYGSDDWVKHRDPNRFFRNLSTIFDSGVVVQLLNEVTTVTAIAVFVVLWNTLAVLGYVDLSGIEHEPILNLPKQLLLALPPAPFSLSSSVLGLMLVFRTNTCYFRWNEARSCWGMIVQHTRNIMRMGTSWSEIDKADEQLCREALKNLELGVWEFSRSLQRHLLTAKEDEEAFQKEVRARLNPKAAEELIAAPHRPTRALFDLTLAVEQLKIPYLRRIEIDKSIVVLCDMNGACERLLTSPIPLVYTRHTARILSLWLLLLPLSLWNQFGDSWNHIAMIPCSFIISFFFFGIEELAVQLEEPFSILPLAALSEGIYARATEYNKSFDQDYEAGNLKPGMRFGNPNQQREDYFG